MLNPKYFIQSFLSVILVVLLTYAITFGEVSQPASGYNPLRPMSAQPVQHIDLTMHDQTRNRHIPLRIYLPSNTDSSPIVLFSHGLGGTRKGCSYLGNHWASRGYVSVFLQHQGSDDSVWKDRPARLRMAEMRKAASPQNFLSRVEDVEAVLDQITVWNQMAGHELHRRLDLTRVGMSGHSFGARTTQAVSGQSYNLRGVQITDARIRAAVILSPSNPRRGDPADAFGSVRIPWMLMTGTKDVSPIGGVGLASRLGVYPHLPAGGKYELVLHGAEHSAFTDRPLPGDTRTRNPNHHRAIIALSTAFWDAYLREENTALAWLEGAGPRSVLEGEDRWQFK